MANRYWVGGSGTWDASDTSHWSASSGGSAGASAPVDGDTVYFDGSSGAGTVSVTSASCGTLICTGYTGTLICYSGLDAVAFSQSATLSSGGTYSALNLLVASDTATLDPVGKAISKLTIGASSSINCSVTLTSALSCSTLEMRSSTDKAQRLYLKAGVTHTISSFDLLGPGTDGNSKIQSDTSGVQATITDASGTNTMTYLDIKDINFTGGATWVASTGCTDGGNNTGITGLPSPASNAIDALFALSFA